MFWRNRLLLLGVLCTSISPILGVEIGDEVCITAFVMDEYCLVNTGGFLLDRPRIRSLEQPDQHSVHCLVDVGVCRNSNFNLLGDKTSANGLFTREYQVDDDGKAMLLGIARQVGIKRNDYEDCTTCSDNGSIDRGFRATVMGTVTALAAGGRPPTISVISAEHSTAPIGTTDCPTPPPPTRQPTRQPTTNRPTPAPVAAPTTNQPTTMPVTMDTPETMLPTSTSTASPSETPSMQKEPTETPTMKATLDPTTAADATNEPTLAFTETTAPSSGSVMTRLCFSTTLLDAAALVGVIYATL